MRVPFTAILFSLSLLATVDASAAERRRAVTMPSAVTVNLTGDVLDSVTNQPVISAEVSVGGELVRTGRTGKFSIAVPQSRPISVKVARAGYQTVTSQLTLAASTTQTIRLTPKPTVRVVTMTNQTYELDGDTIEFGYAEPFAGLRRSRTVKFCQILGGELQVDRDEIKRFDGPATVSAGTGCCPSGAAALGINVQVGAGAPQRLYFTDSCLGFPMLLQGHDHKTWEIVYVRFTEVKEVIFP